MSKITVADAARALDALEEGQRNKFSGGTDRLLRILEQTTGDQAEACDAQAEAVTKLRDAIRKGASTGSKARDFAIIIAGSRYVEVELYYRDLETKIHNLQGEFILVVQFGEERVRYSCFPGTIGPGDYSRQTESWSLGVLSGELVFDMENGECSFPTSRFITQENQVVEGNLCPRNDYGSHFLPHLGTRQGGLSGHYLHGIEIYLGDQEVEGWFKKRGILPHFHRAAERIGRQLLPESILEREKKQELRMAHQNLWIELIQLYGDDSEKRRIANIREAAEKLKSLGENRTAILVALSERIERLLFS